MKLPSSLAPWIWKASNSHRTPSYYCRLKRLQCHTSLVLDYGQIRLVMVLKELPTGLGYTDLVPDPHSCLKSFYSWALAHLGAAMGQ